MFNTLVYTTVASAIKFALGLYLALLLNRSMPFKALIRAAVLIPFIVPTVLSAIAFWWIYDSQFSIISWSLTKMGLTNQNINFLGDSTWARGERHHRQHLARACRSSPLRCSRACRRCHRRSMKPRSLDGSDQLQRFRYITYPLLTPIIAVVMTSRCCSRSPISS